MGAAQNLQPLLIPRRASQVAQWWGTHLECRRHRRCGLDPQVGKIPWKRAWQPTPVFLPGESHGQRSLAGYSPGDCQEMDKRTKHACTLVPRHKALGSAPSSFSSVPTRARSGGHGNRLLLGPWHSQGHNQSTRMILLEIHDFWQLVYGWGGHTNNCSVSHSPALWLPLPMSLEACVHVSSGARCWGRGRWRGSAAAAAAAGKKDHYPQRPSNGCSSAGIQFMKLMSMHEQLTIALKAGLLYLHMVLNVGQTSTRETENISLCTLLFSIPRERGSQLMTTWQNHSTITPKRREWLLNV